MTFSEKICGLTLSLAALAVLSGNAMAENQKPSLGVITFETSCTTKAQAMFERGLLQLHHMMYRHAAMAFGKAASADPKCAMAQWGLGMSKFHPLWPGGPTPEEATAGRAAAEKLATLDHGSALEAAMIAAMRAFYEGDDVPYRTRLIAWAKSQRAVAAQFPNDAEARAFDTLAQLTLAPRGPAAVPDRVEAGERMDALRIEAPHHPAAYHYAIHAYDQPALAERGLEPSRAYTEVAPENPHALHMPTHIFTRLGLWEESADLNERSAAAVIAQNMGDTISGHYIHAIDYAIYAHLQMDQTTQAEALLAEMEGIPNHENNFGTAYAAAAAPSRVPLEDGDWEAATRLPTILHSSVSWERYPQAVAIRWFAIGIGAARTGDTEAAQLALAKLSGLMSVLEARKAAYWAALSTAQSKSIKAWLAHINGEDEAALTLMREAADIEDKVGKAPVTPGHVLPARELLGDLLLATGDKSGAAEAYQMSLKVSPNRRRSLIGLSIAAGS